MSLNGLITVSSAFNATQTRERIEAAICGRGMTIFARVDHAAGAAEIRLPLRPTYLLILDAAKAGTR